MVRRMFDPVSLTEQLVSFDTVSVRPNEALCQRIAALVQPLGGRVRAVPSPHDAGQLNLLVRFGPEGAGGLALAGHTDTVPFDGSMRATDRPERSGGLLYGRGTCDMKGAIAAMLCAAEAAQRDRLKKPLWLAFTFQEEIGCHGAKLLASTAPLPVEHVIVGEPTSLRPVTVHKGYVVARVRLRGTSCHSSNPRAGASAIHGAARVVDALLDLGASWQVEPRDERLQPPYTTLNVGLISGGTARNIVPDRAELTVETRPLPAVTAEELLARVEERAREAAATVCDLELELEPVEANAPLSTPASAPVVRWLVEQRGVQPGSVPFYTEGQLFNSMGAQAVICGPGAIEQAHRADEYVAMDALEEAASLYRGAIEEFCY